MNTSASKVYMVGTQQSLKTNQWQAMTPSRETAEEYSRDNPEFDTIKEVHVKQRRRGGKR